MENNWDLFEENSQRKLKKYISVEVPKKDEDNKELKWWIDDDCIEIIKILERENPNYEFIQLIVAPVIGLYKDIVIMKLKEK